MFIGLPHKKAKPYQSLWLKELQKFLVEELKVDSSDQENYDVLCENLKHLDPTSPKPVIF